MQMLPGPSAEEFAEAVQQLGAISRKALSHYSHGFVMPEAERSLHAVYSSESPDESHRRRYAADVIAAVAHLHQRGVGHFDVKMMNALRMNGRICITDLDASAILGSYGERDYWMVFFPPTISLLCTLCCRLL